MKDFKIDEYLEGLLSPKEKAAFEEELKHNEGLKQELAFQQAIAQSLEGLGLRQQVLDALEEPTPTPKSRKGNNFWYLLLLIPLFLAIGWLMRDPAEPIAPVSTPTESTTIKSPEKRDVPPAEDPSLFEIQPAPAPKKKDTKNSNRSTIPIAEDNSPKIIPDRVPRPNIRGSVNDSDWNILMDSVWVSRFLPESVEFNTSFQPTVQLLKDQDFTKAFVRLRLLERKKPENDTLHFLKGYCFTELREGQEALKQFEAVNSVPEEWSFHLDWYLTLNYLNSGETKKAEDLLIKMSNTPDHPFQKDSQKALEILRQ